ncbi:MAG: ANTAR domain-containing protein, partial [Lachnospiraceae bacterium]|nr:ANTAR domain-containing protein [Candidatus Equihabitans merdae]
ADHVDLAIVDINIPTFDGITVVEKINELRKIPCIIVTAYCDDDLIARANRAGVYGYLQKPIDRYDLISAIGVASERFKEFSRLQMETDKAIKALEDRKLVDRAKGILMDRFGLKEADAMRALQKKARDNNLKLAEAAKGIIIAERML